MGNRVNFYFKCYKRSIHLISNALSIVEKCQYTCPGGWVAQAMWWVAQAMWSELRRLCGGSNSDYNTKLLPRNKGSHTEKGGSCSLFIVHVFQVPGGCEYC